MMVQYKCSSCGADMVFDSKTGRLICEFCGRSEDIPDTSENHIEHEVFPDEQIRQYICESCGAVIMADMDTTATNCSFCGSPVILRDRLSGELAPLKIIPFSITKEDAQNSFRKWCKNGLLTPKGFMNADRIKEITGMYVPFWLYDLEGMDEINATCTKVKHYSDSDYNYTETSYYSVYRKVKLNYLKVPCDASEKMDDKLMDKLEPYDYNALKKFEMPYLSGYLAEKYNFTDKELYERIKTKVSGFISSYAAKTIHGYSTTIYNNETIKVAHKQSYYTLLPVWMVRYNFHQKDHTFLMNGQTGKIVGSPPLCKKKIFAWFSGISASVFLLFRLLTVFAGGII